MSDITWTNDTATLGELVPWQRNPKRISKAHAKRLLDYWHKIGQFQTVAIGPGGEVYDGHQRLSVLLAAHGNGYTLDVRRSNRPLTDEERQELVIAAHVGTTGQFDWDELSGWDADALQAWGMDDELLANWRTDIAGLDAMLKAEQPAMGEDPGAQVDKAAELQAKWQTATGQLWQLGEHRLICGDCTDAAVVARVMGGERAQVLVFDPEWDAMPETMSGFDSVLAFCDGATIGDVVTRYGAPTWLFAWDCVTSWYTPNRPLRRMKLCAWYGDVTAYQFDGWHYGDAGDVRTVANTRGQYEFVPDSRGKHLSDVFQEPITQTHGDGLHNHSKPADWVTLLIANCTAGLVYDPFLGSGTTLIACERLGQRCRAVENEPGYVGVCLERWATMTGGVPVLLETNSNGEQEPVT